MPLRQEALVKPELLVWARMSSRLDAASASKKIGVSQERLEEWENGGRRPTVAQLRKMAGVYKRPIAAFYLSEPPTGFDAMHIHDFRRLPDGGEMRISPDLAFEIRKAEQRREVALELSGVLDKPGVPARLIGLDDDPDQAAGIVRDLLDIPVTQQFKWTDKYEAFKAWKDAIEDLGALVFQTVNIPLEEMRGTSVDHDLYPVIILNGHDWPSGKIFSLIHELTHLLLRQSGICNLHEVGPSKRIEVFCNHVTGAVLAPTNTKETGGHPPYFRMAIRNNGTRYTRIILDAYHDDSITVSDVSDYLGIKLKHLPAIEQELSGSGSEVWQ